MKVFLSPHFSGEDTAQGGIRRVWEAQVKYFPELGIEIVDDLNNADLAACHATEIVNHPVIVAHNHGLYWDGYDWAAWAYRANQKLVHIIKQARVTTTPSQWVANSIRRGMLIDPIVCPHGIDIDDWKPQKHLGYVVWAKTRIDPICNPYDMNKLASKAPGIRFVSTFGKEADNVTLTGALPLPQMKPFIQGADIYLATVKETGAITLLEAMASGVVPLGWNYGANSEIIDHKVNGYLAEPGNFDDLFEGLLYCKANQKELSDNAYQSVIEHHQWKDVIGNYKFAYALALSRELTKSPAVSIIVTAYNLENYLPSCLDSVLSQDYTDWELIIVDDNSPDNCGTIADDYAKKDTRIKVIHNKTNMYLAEARNIAIRAASGRYILPLDADDQLGINTLGILVGSLDHNTDNDIVTGAMELIEEDGRRWVSSWPTNIPNYNEQIAEHNQVPYASMYRRWVWERTGGYRRRYKTAEDAEFWTRAMSFGAKPAKITNQPTLIYSNRTSSMSHKQAPIHWTSWFPWAKYPELTPYAASGEPPRDELFWQVNSYEPIKVSVIIPCGPGHDWYLQDALDSLVAQTFLDWECIVVNDTGIRWFEDDILINPYLEGFPWVKIIDSEGESLGVANARTIGTMAAKSPLVFYLDADDYLQSIALDVFVKTQKMYGGWVYSDWYDQNMQVKEAQDWNADNLTNKMLGPMTGIYPRDAMLAVMFEDFGGWEDWDAQLSLLERGICGTHIAYPLFTYRYQTGTRREDNFEKAESLLQYIKTKHSRLYKEGDFMAGCRKCGGGGGRSRAVPTSNRSAAYSSSGQNTDPEVDGMVLIEYVGPMTQFRHQTSKVRPGVKYRYGGNPGSNSRKFFVYKSDLSSFISKNDFVVVPIAKVNPSIIEDMPVLEAYTNPTPVLFEEFVKKEEPKPESTSISQLKLSPETISILQAAGFDTVEQIKALSIAQLVTIKGIGATRAAKVLQAVKET